MLGDDPPYLQVGTEVSAKYKGAFCEAKVRKVVKQVKAKVTLKYNMGTVLVSDECVKGRLAAGAAVEVKHPDKGHYVHGTVAKVQDFSQYTVVFDDGDIMTLRRTSLCLKSGRHFTEAESLDHLPLTHPEHFSNPVRGRRRTVGDRRSDDSSSSSSGDEEQVDGEAAGDVTGDARAAAGQIGETNNRSSARKQADWSLMIGKVVSVDMIESGRKKRDNWFPALVVAPTSRIDTRRDYLVRSFQDGRYYTVPKKGTSQFQRDSRTKNNCNLKTGKEQWRAGTHGSVVTAVTRNAAPIYLVSETAIDKVLLYLEKGELPAHWDRDSLFNTGHSCHGDAATESDSEDDESREDKDHFVARLYKFMDDRGTPINRAPTVGARDLDLHKLWKAVQRQGGYNRVSNQNVWRTVGLKLLQSGASPLNTNSVKVAYKRYLLHFEEFQRKLGCSLVLDGGRNAKSRMSYGGGRSLIRERERTSGSASPSPAPPRNTTAAVEPVIGIVTSSGSSEITPATTAVTTVSCAPVVSTTCTSTASTAAPAVSVVVARTRAVRRERRGSTSSCASIESGRAPCADVTASATAAAAVTSRRPTVCPTTTATVRHHAQQQQSKENKRHAAVAARANNKMSGDKHTASRRPPSEPARSGQRTAAEAKHAAARRDGKHVARVADASAPPVTSGHHKLTKQPPTAAAELQQDKPACNNIEECVGSVKSLTTDNHTSGETVKSCVAGAVERKPCVSVTRERRVSMSRSSTASPCPVSSGAATSDVSASTTASVTTTTLSLTTTAAALTTTTTTTTTTTMSATTISASHRPNSPTNERRRPAAVKRARNVSPESDWEGSLAENIDVHVGDKVSVLYKINQKKEKTIYEAKVLQVDSGSSPSRYFIHYLNWNKRYDEWVKHSRIVSNHCWSTSRARRVRRTDKAAVGVKCRRVSASTNTDDADGEPLSCVDDAAAGTVSCGESTHVAVSDAPSTVALADEAPSSSPARQRHDSSSKSDDTVAATSLPHTAGIVKEELSDTECAIVQEPVCAASAAEQAADELDSVECRVNMVETKCNVVPVPVCSVLAATDSSSVSVPASATSSTSTCLVTAAESAAMRPDVYEFTEDESCVSPRAAASCYSGGRPAKAPSVCAASVTCGAGDTAPVCSRKRRATALASHDSVGAGGDLSGDDSPPPAVKLRRISCGVTSQHEADGDLATAQQQPESGVSLAEVVCYDSSARTHPTATADLTCSETIPGSPHRAEAEAVCSLQALFSSAPLSVADKTVAAGAVAGSGDDARRRRHSTSRHSCEAVVQSDEPAAGADSDDGVVSSRSRVVTSRRSSGSGAGQTRITSCDVAASISDCDHSGTSTSSSTSSRLSPASCDDERDVVVTSTDPHANCVSADSEEGQRGDDDDYDDDDGYEQTGAAACRQTHARLACRSSARRRHRRRPQQAINLLDPHVRNEQRHAAVCAVSARLQDKDESDACESPAPEDDHCDVVCTASSLHRDDHEDRGDHEDHDHPCDSRAPVRCNFLITFDLGTDSDTRVHILSEQIDKLKDRYGNIKSEVSRLHRRIKKLRKKQKEASSGGICGDSVRRLRPSFVAQ